ncbi:MAG: hypothetical protein R3A78_12630 [Polyangiales bacterium]|nr:hypothetical protein [Myxococcales bacterium]
MRASVGTIMRCLRWPLMALAPAFLFACAANSQSPGDSPQGGVAQSAGKADTAIVEMWGHDVASVAVDDDGVWVELALRSKLPVTDSLRPELEIGEHRFARSVHPDGALDRLRFHLTRAEYAALRPAARTRLRSSFFNQPDAKADSSGVPAPHLPETR